MRILVALGGNALLRNVETAAAGLATLAAEHELIVTHESEGMVGHMLELALRNALPDRDVVSVLTEVVAAEDDPAFGKPSKPIGPVYDERQARELRFERGWTIGRDRSGYRRLVPSPEPRAIAEIRSLRALVGAGALVVCAGGGIPVAMDGLGSLHGVEAVIDKDLTAALLARRLDADMLLMLTDVAAVHADWGGPRQHPLAHVTPHELRELDFAAGSMGPKVEAACRFSEATGGRAAIGALSDAVRVARGGAGTQVLAPVVEPARR